MKRILIADENSLWAGECKRALQAAGYSVRLVYTAASLVPILADTAFDFMVVRDSLVTKLPKGVAIPFPYSLVGSRGDVWHEQAVSILPVNILPKDVCDFIGDLNPKTNHQERFGKFIGVSPAMRDVYKKIEAAAASQATVCIAGESGTGKELCAQAVHRLSERSKKPFIPVNCAAIPESLMESELFGHVKGAYTGAETVRSGAILLAEGGTLFLDEIGEMPLPMQAKLLRFLQSFEYSPVGANIQKKADIRVICATNRDLLDCVENGTFRSDLYYRLFVLPIEMPPLRGRSDDILDIAHAALRRFSKEEHKGFAEFDKDVQDLLVSYDWPGNVRELENIIRQISVMFSGDVVTSEMVPPSLSLPASGASGTRYVVDVRPLHVVEREAIEGAIKRANGHIAQAAQMLEINPSTLYRKRMSWNAQLSA